jgi:hypothetical protein
MVYPDRVWDVASGFGCHGRIPWTADRLRLSQRAVTGRPVLISSVHRQYCPELRIPLNCSTGLPCQRPGLARAAVAGDPAPTAGSVMIAWYVFMIRFLFTIVNTQYGRVLFIYPDFASGFAALSLFSYLCESIIPQISGYTLPVYCWKPRYNIRPGQLTIVNFREPAV